MATHSSLIKKVITVGFFAAAAALIVPSSVYAEGGHDSGTEKGHKGSGGESGHKGKGGESSHGKKTTIVGDSAADTKGKKGATTKPWAHDGISIALDGETVELGRLNAGRAPAKVLDQQLWELIKTFKDSNVPAVYTDPTVTSAATLISYIGDLKERLVKIDSPLTNLALYKEMLINGKTSTSTFTRKEDGIETPYSLTQINLSSSAMDSYVLAAFFLASAAEKESEISLNTVKASNLILGIKNIDDTIAQQIADDANAIRKAMLTNHDTY